MISKASRSVGRSFKRFMAMTGLVLALSPLEVNAQSIPNSSAPQWLGTSNGKVLFAAQGPSGLGLWRTDGSKAGTVFIKLLSGPGTFIIPASTDAQPAFVRIGARGYFVVTDTNGSGHVWMTDGTPAGTRQAVTSSFGGWPFLLGAWGNKLVFNAPDFNNNQQLYVTDGTPSGTRALTAFSEPNAGVTEQFLSAGNKFYFVATNRYYERAVWVSNGTVPGTHKILNPWENSSVGANAFYNPHSFRRIGNAMLYTSAGLLWKIEIATDKLSSVQTPSGIPGFGPPRVMDIADLVVMGSFVLFLSSADGGSSPSFTHFELWRSNGSALGTTKVANTTNDYPGYPAAAHPVFQKVGGRVVYVGDDGQNGPQLWSSAGAPSNTKPLTHMTDLAPEPYPPAIPLLNTGNFAYFALPNHTDPSTWAVVKTGGLTTNTSVIGAIPSMAESVAGLTLAAGNDARAFFGTYSEFAATGSLFSYQTASGRVTPLKSDLVFDRLSGFFYANGLLFFGNDDPASGVEPWISNGTAAGTKLLKDIYP